MNSVEQLAPKDAVTVIVGNKIDLEENRVVSTETGNLMRHGRGQEIQ